MAPVTQPARMLPSTPSRATHIASTRSHLPRLRGRRPRSFANPARPMDGTKHHASASWAPAAAAPSSAACSPSCPTSRSPTSATWTIAGRANAAAAAVEKAGEPGAEGRRRLPPHPRRQGGRRPRSSPPATTGTPRPPSSACAGRQARLRREAVQPQPARRRAARRRRPASTSGTCRWATSAAARPLHRGDRSSCARASSAGRTSRKSWYFNNRPSIGNGKLTDPPKGLDYDLWQGPAPRRPFQDNYLHYNWHWFWHWGNGELGNNGIHIDRPVPLGPGRRLPDPRHARPAAATASTTTRRRPTRTPSASSSPTRS